MVYPSVVHLEPVTGTAGSALGSCVISVDTYEPAGTEMDQVARQNQAAELKWSSDNKLILL